MADRYTAAVAQLGSDTLDVRLGGLYALEQIAVDSATHHHTVVEVLSTFVRGNTPSSAGPAPCAASETVQPTAGREARSEAAWIPTFKRR